jgi:hypothetical protein
LTANDPETVALGEAIEPLEFRDGQWLPASAPDDAKLLLGFAEERNATGEAYRVLELGQQSSMMVRCPGCTGLVPYVLESQYQDDGDEHIMTKPCPICEYSQLVTIVPVRAVILRSRIEKLQKVGVGPRNVERYNALLRQYRRVMRRADRARERRRANDGAE